MGMDLVTEHFDKPNAQTRLLSFRRQVKKGTIHLLFVKKRNP